MQTNVKHEIVCTSQIMRGFSFRDHALAKTNLVTEVNTALIRDVLKQAALTIMALEIVYTMPVGHKVWGDWTTWSYCSRSCAKCSGFEQHISPYCKCQSELNFK